MPAASILALVASILLFAYWRYSAEHSGADRMRALAGRAQMDDQPAKDEPFTRRVMFPAFNSLVSRATEMLPSAFIAQLRQWLLLANSSMRLTTFLAILLAIAVTVPLAYLAGILIATGGLPTGPLLLGLPLLTGLAVAFPVLTLRRRALDRQEKILKALPESLDLLTTCVEAGLNLDDAFKRVADRLRGPVSAEITWMLREKTLGQTRKDALTGMAERIGLPDVNVFTQSVIQAESQGTSIAGVLRVQARQLRIRRRQRAEEAAQKAGPKMVFPLVFFILPSLFIVVLGPVAIDVLSGIQEF